MSKGTDGSGLTPSADAVRPKTMYRTTKYSDKIEAREIFKETEKCVFFKTPIWGGKLRIDKEAKDSGYHKWWDSEREALQYLIAKSSMALTQLKRDTAAESSRLGQLQSRLRKMDSEASPAQPEQSSPVTSQLPQGNPQERNER